MAEAIDFINHIDNFNLITISIVQNFKDAIK